MLNREERRIEIRILLFSSVSLYVLSRSDLSSGFMHMSIAEFKTNEKPPIVEWLFYKQLEITKIYIAEDEDTDEQFLQVCL